MILAMTVGSGDGPLLPHDETAGRERCRGRKLRIAMPLYAREKLTQYSPSYGARPANQNPSDEGNHHEYRNCQDSAR